MNKTALNKHIVVIGNGQMGGVFAHGFFSSGYPVYPVCKGMTLQESAGFIKDPAFVLVAVPENNLHDVLKKMPENWRNKIGLLQNELLPKDWKEENIKAPTIMAVWFEKKKGRGVNVFQATPVCGPYAEIIQTGLNRIDIPCDIITDPTKMLTELVKKNLYVITINIAGLKVGGTTGELVASHMVLTKSIANDVIDIQEYLTGEKFNREDLISFLIDICKKIPDHVCAGRVAADRLDRMLVYAKEAGIKSDVLKQIRDQI